MSKISKFLITTAMAVTTSTSAFAADVTMIISSWAPPSHAMNAVMWPKLIETMEAATNGKVTGEIKYGLAPPPAQMDLILDGAADMTWIFPGYNPGRFVGTKLIELPGYEGNAEAASVAYWRVYKKHLAALDEHKGVKLIGLMTHGPGQFHSGNPITTLAQMKGVKTRLGGGVSGDVGKALGLVGLRVPAPKVYETLASGAADAVAMPAEGRKSFKLTEVAPNYYIMPGGLYRGAFSLLMNQEKFDSLPDDVQAALDSKVFGEALSRMAGAAWDLADALGLEATLAASDNTVVNASSADIAAFSKIADQIIASVKQELSAKGVDAEAAHAMVVREMAK